MRSTINLTLNAELGTVETIDFKEEEEEEEPSSSKYLRIISFSKWQVFSSYLGLVIPLLISIYYTWTRKQRNIFSNIRKQISTVDFDVLSAISGDVLQITVSNRLVRSLLGNEADVKSIEESVKCEVLHDPGESLRETDVIFIHGIKGALDKTWTQGIWRLAQLRVLNFKEDKTWEVETVEVGEERSVCWPRDWLPKDCPKARVIAINYTTDPYLWRPFFFTKRIRSNMEERSWEMMKNLAEIGVGKHSIIWVGHSKGGLYVKQMLVNYDSFNSISRSTKGIMFYSVPHRGSILANLNLPLFRQSIELTEVKKNCEEVLTLHRKFLDLLSQKQLAMDVKSFIETKLTQMGLLYVRIVSEESADAEIGELYGVPLDHRNICKPKNRECFLYKELVNMIQGQCANE